MESLSSPCKKRIHVQRKQSKPDAWQSNPTSPVPYNPTQANVTEPKKRLTKPYPTLPKLLQVNPIKIDRTRANPTKHNEKKINHEPNQTIPDRTLTKQDENRTNPTKPNQTEPNSTHPEQTRLDPTKFRPNRTAPTKNQTIQIGQQPPVRTTSAAADSCRQQHPAAKRARAIRSKQRQTATSKETPDSNRQQHTAILKGKCYLNSRAAHRDKQRQTAASGAGGQNSAAGPRGTPSKISFFGGTALPNRRFCRWEEAGRSYLQGMIKWSQFPGVASPGS